jgi:hypothetical protein
LGKTNLGAADTTRDEAWSVPLRIAVGTYTGSLRIDDNNPDFSANVFTSQGQPQTQLASVYDASFGYQIMIDNVNANDPGLVTRNFADFFPGPPPNQFWQFRGPTLVHPATFDQTTKEFRWNTTGAILGEYSWHTAYLTDQGDWDPHVDITVRITAVPESATFSLLTLAGFGSFVLIRRVRAEG